jgi:tRNA (guanine-N7-)-methyltransferase
MPTTSNQTQPHQDLVELVSKYLKSTYKKPIAEHSSRAFDQLFNQLKNNKASYIIDSGCGTGLSCKWLSQKFPENHIIGIDKSEHRLSKTQFRSDNITYCRSDLIDFWRILLKTDWQIEQHYMLYPNPWPKKKHLQRRWHGHPIFPEILKIGKTLTIRSDWDLYIDEFELALNTAGINNISKTSDFRDNAMSAFEQKYITQGRRLFELKAELKK